jgi:hypothetical protein
MPPFGARKKDPIARPMTQAAPSEETKGALTRNPLEQCRATSDRAPMTSPALLPSARATASQRADPGGLEAGLARRGRRLSWSELLQRVFGVEALRCQCGEPMWVRTAITEPAVARRILECLGLSPRAPPLPHARTPDWVPDPWLEEPPSADFDQTPPEDWDTGA